MTGFAAANAPLDNQRSTIASRPIRMFNCVNADARGSGTPPDSSVNTMAATAAVKRALMEVVREPAEQVRALELDRLDLLYRTALGVMARSHPMVQNGRVVRDEEGRSVEDSGPRLAAVDRLLRIQERRARLLGVGCPDED